MCVDPAACPFFCQIFAKDRLLWEKRSCCSDFAAKKSGPPKARNQFRKSVCIAVLHVTHLDGEAQLTSVESLTVLHTQLGLPKVELAKQLGISHQSLYGCI
jgi:hypothetical protein